MQGRRETQGKQGREEKQAKTQGKTSGAMTDNDDIQEKRLGYPTLMNH